MDRSSLLKVIAEKTNEIFYEYQKANGITNGDISPGDYCDLEKIQENLADLIIRVSQHNKLKKRIKRNVKEVIKTCYKCHSEVEDEKDFCPYCGACLS